MTDDPGFRSIDISVDVDGSPEEVWRAIATGPGITSWYVPHEVEEREGGDAMASFGSAPEMQIAGRVVAWDPPNRIVFASDDPEATLAFEWLVEARDGGSCVVRLINSGFGTGEEWDDHYDGMSEGWQLFLLNLQLHLRHFRGLDARPMLPMAQWPGGRAAVWARLLESLGLPANPEVGQHVRSGEGVPPLAGTVVDATVGRMTLILDEPARGTAFVAAEGKGDDVGVSVWQYLYGDDRERLAQEFEPAWAAWLADPPRGAHG